MNELDDKQLVNAYLKGSTTALEILIQRHLNAVLAFVVNFTKDQSSAEDITQETFVKAWRHLKKYNSDYSFKTWLFTIAKHSALDHLKKKTELSLSQLESTSEELNFQPLFTETPLSMLDNLVLQDSADNINQAISNLPDKYQATVKLHYQQDLSFREIGVLLAMPLDTIKTRHRRALVRLKKLLS